MSFFSKEQASELKELFFESAQELLQTLNEEGLELERKPGDSEVVRSVRRTVHTLKGDSAACGYRELSELAHELEDTLTPEIAATAQGSLAELVLTAADTFGAMLAAYRNNAAPPGGDAVRAHIQRITSPQAAPKKAAKPKKRATQAPKFKWSEYEQLAINHAIGKGQKVYEVALSIAENCPLRAAAMQLVRNVLEESGTLLALQPEEKTPPDDIHVIQAALASEHDEDWIARKCHIPAVVSDIQSHPYQPASAKPAKPAAPAKQAADVAAATAHLELNASLLDLPAPAEPAKKAKKPEAPEAAPEGKKKFAAYESERRMLEQQRQQAEQAAAETTLRVDAERIDAVLNLVGELIIGKSMLTQSVNEFDKRFPKDALRGKFGDAMAFQARVLSDLQKSVMKIRMVPVEQLFRRFPRLVRDVAKMREREVGLTINGQDTDLDKSILDALAEPLTHIIRNAVDHGIESPEERTAAGKPAQGTISLNAYHQGNQVVIEVRDDGRGIDHRKVLEKAIENKLTTRADAAQLSESEALEFIFQSGLSTADEVTEISGRGVGMDVVKTVLQRLKGTVHIETRLGKGTTFFLKVPLTLAIIKALLFRVGSGTEERTYAVPLAAVLEITRAQEAEIHRVDQHEVIRLRDLVLTLVRVGKLNRRQPARTKKVFIVVIALGDRRFGLVVDRLVGEEELVIKALDDNLVATELVSGASILGDGSVVLILNLAAVVSRLGRVTGENVPAKGATA